MTEDTEHNHQAEASNGGSPADSGPSADTDSPAADDLKARLRAKLNASSGPHHGKVPAPAPGPSAPEPVPSHTETGPQGEPTGLPHGPGVPPVPSLVAPDPAQLPKGFDPAKRLPKPEWEKFCQLAKVGADGKRAFNLSDAYRSSVAGQGTKRATINRGAARLARKPEVAARLVYLSAQEQAAGRPGTPGKRGPLPDLETRQGRLEVLRTMVGDWWRDPDAVREPDAYRAVEGLSKAAGDFDQDQAGRVDPAALCSALVSYQLDGLDPGPGMVAELGAEVVLKAVLRAFGLTRRDVARALKIGPEPVTEASQKQAEV